MNILLVSAYAAPYEGNFMKSLYALDNRLVSLGHTVIYAFCEYARENMWIKDLQQKRKIYFLPQRYARINPKTYLLLKQIIRKEEISIIHSHFELYDLPISIVATKKTKIVWHLHDTIEDNYNKENMIRKLLCKIQYKVFSKRAILCSVSKKHMRFVINLGFDSKHAIYVPNGADFNRLRKTTSNAIKYQFLIFAWDFYRKGADIAIKAADQLYQDGYKFMLGVVGSDDLWKNQSIRDVIEKPWFVKQEFVDDISDLYNSTKCFLHISRSEGCSYALIEASFFGLPIISSDIEENMFLRDLPTITMIESGSVSETYKAMKKMIENNYYMSEEDAAKSKSIILNDYSLDAWVNRMINVYKNYCNLL